MIFTKTSFYKKYKKPIDKGRVLKDGKRIFGDNKTWVGFISMIIFCIIFQLIWGILTLYTSLKTRNEMYVVFDNTLLFNILSGFLFGLAYMVCELPNSFIKRRLNIESGKTDKGLKGIVFFVIDQIDSLIGVFLVLMLLNRMTFLHFLLYLFVGAITHILVNLVLFKLKVRRNL